jgi:hypothetical protein
VKYLSLAIVGPPAFYVAPNHSIAIPAGYGIPTHAAPTNANALITSALGEIVPTLRILKETITSKI